MRIVQHTFDFGLGGIQKAPAVFAQHAAAMGHECYMLAERPGPRMNLLQANPTHRLINSPDIEVAARMIEEIDPQVVHLHRASYVEPLIRRLGKKEGRIIVSTPVFGRPPDDPSILDLTCTCHVGCYTFYRFNRWMNWSAEQAIQNRSGFVPITPYTPPKDSVSTLDSPEIVQRRRAEFGIGEQAFVVGRIGRDDVAKWLPGSRLLVESLLNCHPDIVWLSIGFPAVYGRDELKNKWGGRFINLPETPDYAMLMRVLSSMDVQVFFSHGECFASSIAEAAGVGVPTVALATPLRDNGQAEQIIDGQNGFLVGSIAQAVERVDYLKANPSVLEECKRQSQILAHGRWHIARVTRDLISLYEYWLDPAAGRPACCQTMVREHDEFKSHYRRRMVSLMASGPVTAMKWNLGIRAAESWTVFKSVRLMRRLKNWKRHKAIPK